MRNPFKKTYSKGQEQSIHFLKELKIFASLDSEEISLFLPFLYERAFTKNEVIFFRGDPSQALYVLSDGEVMFNIDVNDEFEELIRVKGPHAFGESCLLPGEKRLLNAIITSESANLSVIPQGNIMAIFDRNPKIKSKMLESLGKLLVSYNDNLYRAYKSSMGFFNLSQIYATQEKETS